MRLPKISIGLDAEIITSNLFHAVHNEPDKVDKRELTADLPKPPSVVGDDKFIYWLRDCREAGLQVSLTQVKSKVTEILSSHGQQDVEKTCKWFLLWHNR